jgi:hypothetical protein
MWEDIPTAEFLISKVLTKIATIKNEHKGKGKAIPLQTWTGPEGSRRLRHMKVVRLSAPRTGRLYPPGNIPGTHFC